MYIIARRSLSEITMPCENEPSAITSRRGRRRRETADRLGSAAMALFEAQGFETVTMEQIAAAADVAKGTLYNYFPVKEALLAYQFQREIAAGMNDLAGKMRRKRGFVSRLRFLLNASAEWNMSRRAYLPHYLRFRLMEVEPETRRAADHQHESGTRQIFEKLFRAAQQEGAIRLDMDARELAQTFEFMCLGAAVAWLHQPEVDLTRRFEFIQDVLLNGIIGGEKA